MSKHLLDLPNEILRDVLFKHLEHIDVFSLGETGNTRLKYLAEDYLGYSKGKIKHYCQVPSFFRILYGRVSFYHISRHF